MAAGGLLIFAAAALLVAGYLIAILIFRKPARQVADTFDWSGDTRLAEVLGGEATRETGGGACRAKAGRLGDAQTQGTLRTHSGGDV